MLVNVLISNKKIEKIGYVLYYINTLTVRIKSFILLGNISDLKGFFVIKKPGPLDWPGFLVLLRSLD